MVDLTEDYVRENHLHSLLQIVPPTILIWDYFIGLGTEIDYIWMEPKSRSSIAFLFIRYFSLTTNISVVALSFYPLDTESCQAFSLYNQVLLLVSQCVFCALMALRICALYSPDRRILWFPGTAVICATGLAGYGFSEQSKMNYPVPMVCHIGISQQTSLRIVSLWLALFIYDMVTFILTAARTYKFWRKDNVQPLRMSLFPLLFRDGAIYFAVMAQANLANILTFYLCGPFMRGGLSTFASCISATMLCRLMLNLHSTASTGLYTRPDTTVMWRTMTLDIRDEELSSSSR